jgi:hypothetical protein
MVDTPQCIANKMKSKGLPRFKLEVQRKFSACQVQQPETN